MAEYRAGGIYGDYGAIVVCNNCLFENNAATNGNGGAIFMEDRNSQTDGTYATIVDSTFNSNHALKYGGAICFFNGVSPVIKNSHFVNNVAGLGGAITNYDQIYYDGYSSNVFVNNLATEDETFNNIYNDSLIKTSELQMIDIGVNINITAYLEQLWNNRAVTADFNDNIEQSNYICYVDARSGTCPGLSNIFCFFCIGN